MTSYFFLTIHQHIYNFNENVTNLVDTKLHYLRFIIILKPLIINPAAIRYMIMKKRMNENALVF